MRTLFGAASIAALAISISDGQQPPVADLAPATVIQRQVAAYNAHDADAFASTYATDAQVFNHPSELLESGRDEIRASYAAFFAQAPNVRAEILETMTMGNYVVTRERIAGLPDARTVDGIVIYRVEDGLIGRVWIILE
jgi:hypothetical protein